MAQTPCIFRSCDERIDYTPSGVVTAGQVVVLGTRLVTIAPVDIAANALGSLATEGVFLVPKVTGTITIGSALYWDDNGDPLNGTAGSGAFTTDSAAGPFAGWAIEASSGNTINMILEAVDAAATTLRSALGQNDLQPYPILAESWYIFDSTTHAALGATATSADDLIFTYGAVGTAEPVITATDPGGGTPTQKARVRVTLPPEYVSGQTITLRVHGACLTTVADTSLTVDFNVYRAAAPTVDVCATAAQSINSLTFVDRDFTITPTDCVPGDILDILMTVAGSDAGNLGTMTPTISLVTLLLDIKG